MAITRNDAEVATVHNGVQLWIDEHPDGNDEVQLLLDFLRWLTADTEENPIDWLSSQDLAD